jgi:uncharacterized phage infection (PIP) family protein YhgE
MAVFILQYLERQLDDAREVDESRVKLMEQIEKNHEQLSESHAKLKRETKSIQEHNEVLAESLQSLVEKCDQYKSEMENLKRENTQLQRQLSSTQTPVEAIVVEEVENDIESSEKVESNIQELSVVIKELKFEQDLEKSMREELENELTELIIQNQNLEQKLRLFAKGNRSSLEEELNDDMKNGTELGVGIGKMSEVEIEMDEGCLNESFVIVEDQEILELDSNPSLEQCHISFLSELDQQYRELVEKYNALVEKCKSEGVPYESREMFTVQRGVQTSEEELVGSEVGVGNDAENEGEAGNEGKVERMPEYKQMFARLYEKIQEARNET